jgi:hypothetical protein
MLSQEGCYGEHKSNGTTQHGSSTVGVAASGKVSIPILGKAAMGVSVGVAFNSKEARLVASVSLPGQGKLAAGDSAVAGVMFSHSSANPGDVGGTSIGGGVAGGEAVGGSVSHSTGRANDGTVTQSTTAVAGAAVGASISPEVTKTFVSPTISEMVQNTTTSAEQIMAPLVQALKITVPH